VHEPGDVATLTAQLDGLAAEPATVARLSTAAMAHAPELSWAAASRSLVAAYGHPAAGTSSAEEDAAPLDEESRAHAA
jgi:hypothetical protein